MPYLRNENLPSPVREHLPGEAQNIYRHAFNHAWFRYGRDPRREEIAHRVAWAAVKRRFGKAPGGQWEPRLGT